jgi:hypothetical protein
MDGDVDLDTVFRVGVLLNRGDGVFLDEVRFGAGHEAALPAILDFDRDGKSDLAVGSDSKYISI